LPEKRDWSHLSAFRKWFGEKSREVGECLLAACATGQEMGRTSDPPLSSASQSNYLNSLRLPTAVKAVLRHLTCPAIAQSA